uniref:Reverse transcriptase domain-containing protein n=1 Tax=Cannabis sativa TaxID=3483 RepID=A0A803PYC3_CANSA
MYTEPIVRNGVRIARIDPEEVVRQAENWKSVVVYMVLGANPPMAVFEGFIKRIWGHLGIMKIVRMTMGLVMVKFNDEATKDKVLETGVIQFGKKPVIVRPWSTNLNTEADGHYQDTRKVFEGDTDFCSMNKIGVGALLEKKLKGNKVAAMTDNKFKNWDYFTSNTIEGRQKDAFCVTFVYGWNTMEERKELWRELLKLRFLVKPWLIQGDFNVGFYLDDRTGGNQITLADIADSSSWQDSANVEAIKTIGSNYTWINNQEGLLRIYSRIDHALANEALTDMFPNSVARFKWETNHVEFPEIVKTNWGMPMQATGLRGIYYKLMRLKHKLKKFNWESIGDVGRSYQEARSQLEIGKLQAQENPSSSEMQFGENQAAERFIMQEKMYLSFLKQRSKINWLQKGDENTSFFHASLKKRKMENRITSYVDENGNVIDEFPDVVNHFMEHFRGYMGTKSLTHLKLNKECIGQAHRPNFEQQVDLLKPFMRKEIKKAFFSIPKTKLPGPDGYGAGFFRPAWKDIGAEICYAISGYFISGNMPREFLDAVLSLIPKNYHPNTVIDFRPIACCTTVYKCISMLMCSKLSNVLPSLVHQNTGVVVKGRSIAHNIMILQDLLKNYKRKLISPRCAIKIDISKAYDTVSWDFLEDLLGAFNLPSRFIHMIMECVKSSNYFISMNGRIQGSFKGEKGLRQGDPLSPLLFVLIMEYLTRRLKMAATGTEYNFHPLCKRLGIINLYFADDLILFSKGTRQSMLVLKDVLEEFGNTTGLHISEGKSQIFFGGGVQNDENTAIFGGFKAL